MKLPQQALVIFLLLAIVFAVAYGVRTRQYAIGVRDELAATIYFTGEQAAELSQARGQLANRVSYLEELINNPPPSPVSDAWELVTAPAPFSARDGAFAVSFKGYIWLVNGWTGEEFENHVYRSKDGKDWEIVVEQAPFDRRHLGGFVVLNERLWMIGGDFLTDVWSSSDGIAWEQETAEAPWGERYNPYIGAFDGKLWLMGGLSREFRPFQDIWSSVDGKSWVLVDARAPWPARGLISGFAVHDGAMWIMGGGTKVQNPADKLGAETLIDLRDVWRSQDGKNWELVNARAAWAPRTHLSVGTFDGEIVVVDGSVKTQYGLSNEAWHSKDGVIWAPMGGIAEQAFPPRHASSLVQHDGSQFLIAGYFHNDVWRLDSLQ